MDNKEESSLVCGIMQSVEMIKNLTRKIWQPDKRYKIWMVLGLVGMGLIFCSDSIVKKETPKVSVNNETYSPQNESEQYIRRTEERLEEMISQIDGAGECSVMLTLQEGGKNIYASEDKTSAGQSRDTSGELLRTQDDNSSEKKLVLIEDENGVSHPVIEQRIEPQVKGVVVVCKGAKSANVCQKVTEAVTTVLGIRSNNVCVLTKGR